MPDATETASDGDGSPSRPRGSELVGSELDGEDPFESLDPGALVFCPYCGEEVEIAVDPVGGAVQEYVEDCEVCCRPWRVTARVARDGAILVDVATLDES